MELFFRFVKEVHPSPASPFTTHELRPVKYVNHEYRQFQPDWIFGILIFGFILLAWTQVFYHHRLRQIFLSPFSKRFNNQLIRDGNLFKERVSVALGMLYLLTFSLLLYHTNEILIHLSLFNLKPILKFLVIIAGVSAFWLLKIMVILFLSEVFNTRTTTRAYLLNILTFCILSGIFLLPMLVFILYLKSLILLIICLICLALIFFFRVMKGFFIGVNLTKFSYLFLFVYLCSLEFLPLLILVKVFLMYM